MILSRLQYLLFCARDPTNNSSHSRLIRVLPRREIPNNAYLLDALVDGVSLRRIRARLMPYVVYPAIPLRGLIVMAKVLILFSLLQNLSFACCPPLSRIYCLSPSLPSRTPKALFQLTTCLIQNTLSNQTNSRNASVLITLPFSQRVEGIQQSGL